MPCKDRRQRSLFETPPPRLEIAPDRQSTLLRSIQTLLVEALSPRSTTIKEAADDDADHG